MNKILGKLNPKKGTKSNVIPLKTMKISVHIIDLLRRIIFNSNLSKNRFSEDEK